ncbi:hypothetical protein RFI_09141 [Reticulomyxa filosa]|uniref:Uncharacterized protein n=1 Tax=Reticulomyxa filosa TaxID=46433 RepID=X6NNZ3_RETFI|nr:hypothetical protein RFI_09141 [Reticulomyxa filosa]|eukprot:ETO27990.1 hypothetical protein RFI_09141 [Reticulomyxa filosa]
MSKFQSLSYVLILVAFVCAGCLCGCFTTAYRDFIQNVVGKSTRPASNTEIIEFGTEEEEEEKEKKKKKKEPIETKAHQTAHEHDYGHDYDYDIDFDPDLNRPLHLVGGDVNPASVTQTHYAFISNEGKYGDDNDDEDNDNGNDGDDDDDDDSDNDNDNDNDDNDNETHTFSHAPIATTSKRNFSLDVRMPRQFISVLPPPPPPEATRQAMADVSPAPPLLSSYHNTVPLSYEHTDEMEWEHWKPRSNFV